MLKAVGAGSLDQLMNETVPEAIRLRRPLKIEPDAGRELGEHEVLRTLKSMAGRNRVMKSLIGMGYYGTITPGVILRNIMESPGWYTQYTPYQAEISQGRLEALLNFQTVVSDLTGLPLAGASLLDEGTAAAEAMAMCYSIGGAGSGEKNAFFVASNCHPQTIGVVQTRAKSMGVHVVVGDESKIDFGKGGYCGVLLQYPDTSGRISDYRGVVEAAHAAGALVVVATDLLALTLLTPPGEFGADVAVGSAQRFGVPMGFGGPHAAFISTKTEYARKMPGRLIGVSRDSHGNPAFRMAIQTREQHIRREKATSNICTNSGLCALAFSIHLSLLGGTGLERMARLSHARARATADRLAQVPGVEIVNTAFFNEFAVTLPRDARQVVRDLADRKVLGGVSLGRLYPGDAALANGLLVAASECTTAEDIEALGTALEEVLA